MRSLRAKLVLSIALLVVLIMAATSIVLIDARTTQLTQDIYRNSLSIGRLTTPQLVEAYNLYYRAESFVNFNQTVQEVFRLSPDLAGVGIYDYQGILLFDSASEQNQQYQGEPRRILDPQLLGRLKDIKPSLITESGRVIYLKNNQFVDANEQPVAAPGPKERVLSVMIPFDNQYRVLYQVTYANLEMRIREMAISIAVIFVVSALVAILLVIFLASKIIGPLKTLMRGAVEIGKGNLDVSVKIKTRDELRLLADTFNTMVIDLKKNTEALVEKERIGKELEIAQKIQLDLLPQEMTAEGLQIAAGVEPALEVGGDCYDLIHLPDGQDLIYVGDVTGHGVPSGLVVSMANALIYSFSQMFSTPKEILVHTNAVLKKKTSPDMFLTMLMATWHPKNSTFTYTQAGHDPLLYYSARQKSLRLGIKGGVALGLIPDLSKILKEETLTLESGDLVILFTDGYPESFRMGQNGEREILGFERFMQMVEQVAQTTTSAEAAYRQILAAVKTFCGDYPQFDDMTLIVFRKT